MASVYTLFCLCLASIVAHGKRGRVIPHWPLSSVQRAPGRTVPMLDSSVHARAPLVNSASTLGLNVGAQDAARASWKRLAAFHGIEEALPVRRRDIPLVGIGGTLAGAARPDLTSNHPRERIKRFANRISRWLTRGMSTEEPEPVTTQHATVLQREAVDTEPSTDEGGTINASTLDFLEREMEREEDDTEPSTLQRETVNASTRNSLEREGVDTEPSAPQQGTVNASTGNGLEREEDDTEPSKLQHETVNASTRNGLERERADTEPSAPQKGTVNASTRNGLEREEDDTEPSTLQHETVNASTRNGLEREEMDTESQQMELQRRLEKHPYKEFENLSFAAPLIFSNMQGPYQRLALSLLRTSHEVVRVGMELNNSAADYNTQCERGEVILAVLEDIGGEQTRAIALGEWSTKEKRWRQTSMHANQALDPNLQDVFDVAESWMLLPTRPWSIVFCNPVDQGAMALRALLPGAVQRDEDTGWDFFALFMLLERSFDQLVQSDGYMTTSALQTIRKVGLGQVFLIWAIGMNDLPLAKRLLQFGIHLDSFGLLHGEDGLAIQIALAPGHHWKAGETILMNAVRYDRYDFVHLFIDHGAQINATANSMSALDIAISRNNSDMACFLLNKSSAVVHWEETSLVRALDLATVRNHVDLLEVVVEHADRLGYHMNFTSSLISALKWDSLQVAKALIDKGANADQVLLRAANRVDHRDVMTLVEFRANPNVQTVPDELTPLMIYMEGSVSNGSVAAVQKLLEYGAKLETRDKHGETALTHAVVNGNVEWCKILNGSDIDSTNAYGRSALHEAAFYGHVDVLQHLVTYRASLEQKDKRKFTAVMVAAEKGHDDVVDLLHNAGAKLDAKKLEDILLKSGNHRMARKISQLLAS